MNLDLLAIAAHPDDVELTCGGTLLKMAQRGYKTGILDLTAGEMGTRGTPETRAKEAARAAKLLSVKWRGTLGVPDSDVQPSRQHKLRLAAMIRQLPENCHPAVLGSAPPRPLPCLNSRLRGLFPGGSEATPDGRPGLPPVQDSLFQLLRRCAANVRCGHHRPIRAAPQSHPGLCLAIPAEQERKEKQSPPRHRPPGNRDESVGAAL